jgi:hypothetical protein
VKAARKSPTGDGAAQLDVFLARFDPDVVSMARATLRRVRELAPGAIALVYDAYNALSVPFSSSEQLRDAFVAVVVYPRHVNLAFNRGAELDDPERLLQGEGKLIRHIRATPGVLANEEVARLVRVASENAGLELRTNGGRVVVKAIYERQRSRKPAKRGT